MKLIRKLFTRFTRPSLYVTCMAALVFVAIGLYSIFSFLAGAPVSGLICFFIAALFLGYTIYAVIILILKFWPRLEKWSEGRKYINKFVMSYDFRTVCFTVISMAINLGFCIFNAVYGFMFMEWWSITMFVYYLMLIVMRSSISARALTISRRFDDTSREDAQLRVYRMAAIMLLVFTVALNLLLWELLSQENFGFRHHVLISVVTGIYTVVKVVMAVSNLIYTRGRHDRITHAIRNINMTDALVSVMTLLMTFLTRFSDSTTATNTVLVIGTGICIYVAAMALFMLINSVVKIKKNRRTLYEMLMDSLNEDFEDSLDEPAWDSMYATAQFGAVDYVIEDGLAHEERSESISDGFHESLEATADITDSMLLPPDELIPGYYKDLYAIAGMTNEMDSAADHDDGALEPTPLPGTLVQHPKAADQEDEELEPAPLPGTPAPQPAAADSDEDGFDDLEAPMPAESVPAAEPVSAEEPMPAAEPATAPVSAEGAEAELIEDEAEPESSQLLVAETAKGAEAEPVEDEAEPQSAQPLAAEPIAEPIAGPDGEPVPKGDTAPEAEPESAQELTAEPIAEPVPTEEVEPEPPSSSAEEVYSPAEEVTQKAAEPIWEPIAMVKLSAEEMEGREDTFSNSSDVPADAAYSVSRDESAQAEPQAVETHVETPAEGIAPVPEPAEDAAEAEPAPEFPVEDMSLDETYSESKDESVQAESASSETPVDIPAEAVTPVQEPAEVPVDDVTEAVPATEPAKETPAAGPAVVEVFQFYSPAVKWPPEEPLMGANADLWEEEEVDHLDEDVADCHKENDSDPDAEDKEKR